LKIYKMTLRYNIMSENGIVQGFVEIKSHKKAKCRKMGFYKILAEFCPNVTLFEKIKENT